MANDFRQGVTEMSDQADQLYRVGHELSARPACIWPRTSHDLVSARHDLICLRQEVNHTDFLAQLGQQFSGFVNENDLALS